MRLRELKNKFLIKNDISTVILWVACLMLITSVFMGWLATPLQGNIKGYAFPFMKNITLDIGLNNPFKVSSFGMFIFAIGALGIIFLILRAHPRFLFYLGGAAVIVCLCFIGNMVFLNSEILESLLDQNRQAQEIKVFSEKYLSGTAGHLRPYEDLATDTLLSKMDAGMRYLGVGWYIALLSTLIILICNYYKRAGKSMRWDAVGLTLSLLIVIVTLSARTLMAEYDRSRGDLYLAHGELQKAIDLYKSAVRRDPKLNHNPTYMYNVGAAYYRLGWHYLPETHLYLGDNHMTMKNFPEAAREYEIASTIKADLLLANRKRIDALIMMGLGNYSKGKIYTALSNWEQALQLDPNQIQVHLFLAKALFDINAQDQSKAIIEARAALEKAKDKLVKADIYNLIGDIYYKQRNFVMARQMYNLSRAQYTSVKIAINYNAMKGLQGL